MANALAADLDQVLAATGPLWEELRGQRLFLTGGTGFFGCWLLESFAWANARLKLRAQAVVLSRNPAALAQKAPHLAADAAISFHTGDVRHFEFPAGRFSHVIHAATDTAATGHDDDPLLLLDSIVAGTRRTLEFALASGAQKFLLTSSGAVYGPQPPDLTHIPEDYPGAPDPLDRRSVYGEGKRLAELLCALYRQQHSLETKIARGFAFVGPYLPLDAHFAIGNFIGDALGGGPIRVRGDGTPWRSYCYGADLAIWLWTILFYGLPGRPYNVGSERALMILDVAKAVAAAVCPTAAVQVAQAATPGQPVQRYVPATRRGRAELPVPPEVGLEEALRRTAAWYRRPGAPPLSSLRIRT